MAEKMDLVIVRDNFEKAKSAKGDVDFEAFIKGYEEIARLYDNMGILFHFASNDMRARVRALQTLNKENPGVYSAVLTALDHEKGDGIKKKTKSGAKAASVVLLEMLWDVSFIMNIMQRICDGQDDSKMSVLARESYDQALAAHQSLPIRTAARLACKTLPLRKNFMDANMKQGSAEALVVLPAAIKALRVIHAIMEGAFIKHDLMKEAHAEAEKNRAEDAAQPPVE